MKKLFYVILIVMVLCTVATLYVGYQMVCIATTPYNYGQNYDTAFAMVYRAYPELRPWYDSLEQHGLVRDTTITNAEGTTLHALYMQHSEQDSVQPSGAMMIIHGYCDDAPVMMRYAYCAYEVLGQNVLLPERRWCGKSGGDHITYGWFDRLDMHQWLQVMHQLWHKPVVVHGLSMGAATAMMLSGDEIADSLQVVGYIEDCGYSNSWDLLETQLDERYGLPAFPVLYAASFINRLWHGWWFGDGDAVAQVARCKKPMLFIHGTDDQLVPFKMVHKVFDAKQGEKYLWEVPQTKHAHSIHKHWQEYCQRLSTFINKVQGERTIRKGVE
ncbi:MAG: alpha/beta hydrolase [Bacteroidales bacterium]|nr:alpha/beta hydrolase [Bacteroidales bacterium]